jgi:hypothetical protein
MAGRGLRKSGHMYAIEPAQRSSGRQVFSVDWTGSLNMCSGSVSTTLHIEMAALSATPPAHPGTSAMAGGSGEQHRFSR